VKGGHFPEFDYVSRDLFHLLMVGLNVPFNHKAPGFAKLDTSHLQLSHVAHRAAKRTENAIDSVINVVIIGHLFAQHITAGTKAAATAANTAAAGHFIGRPELANGALWEATPVDTTPSDTGCAARAGAFEFVVHFYKVVSVNIS